MSALSGLAGLLKTFAKKPAGPGGLNVPRIPGDPRGAIGLLGAGERRGFVDKATAVLFGISSGLQVAESLKQAFPSFVHEVTVEITGGPYARIERLWALCTAAAFGKFREGPNFNMKCTSDQYQGIWDITGKKVAFRIVSQRAGLTGSNTGARIATAGTYASIGAAIGSAGGPAGAAIGAGIGLIIAGATAETGNPDGFAINDGAPDAVVPVNPVKPQPYGVNNRQRTANPMRFLLLGPTQEVCGGLPSSVFDGAANGGRRLCVGGLPAGGDFSVPNAAALSTTRDPMLVPIDNGQMITSWYKFDPRFQPPTPPYDGVSRGSIVQLVSAALTNRPGYLPARPTYGKDTPFNSSPSRLYPASSPEPTTIKEMIVRFGRALFPGLFHNTIDGYRLPSGPIDSLRGPDTDIEKFGLSGDLRGKE